MTGIPCVPKTVDRLAGRLGQAFCVQREERIELVQVDIFLLLIDMPEHRPTCPLGANEGVFTAHGIEIYMGVTLLYIISALTINRAMAFIEARVRVPGMVASTGGGGH